MGSMLSMSVKDRQGYVSPLKACSDGSPLTNSPQVPGRLHPISVSYLAQSAEGTQRRSAAQKRELAAKGGRRQAIERIDPTPYLRCLHLPGDSSCWYARMPSTFKGSLFSLSQGLTHA